MLMNVWTLMTLVILIDTEDESDEDREATVDEDVNCDEDEN